jgi:hypothetical protein
MKLFTEYLAHARAFERLAAEELDLAVKAAFEKQAAEYRKLAVERAARYGLPTVQLPE